MDNEKEFVVPVVIDHPKDIVHCMRVIEFTGPREWVNTVLARSFLRPDLEVLPLGQGKEAREIGRVTRTLKRHGS